MNFATFKRDPKDILIVASSCGSFMFHLFNGIPVKEYFGDKLDISFFSLTRYLRSIKDAKDVRTRIKEDFYPGSSTGKSIPANSPRARQHHPSFSAAGAGASGANILSQTVAPQQLRSQNQHQALELITTNKGAGGGLGAGNASGKSSQQIRD